jgi:hypothetical protein
LVDLIWTKVEAGQNFCHNESSDPFRVRCPAKPFDRGCNRLGFFSLCVSTIKIIIKANPWHGSVDVSRICINKNDFPKVFPRLGRPRPPDRTVCKNPVAPQVGKKRTPPSNSLETTSVRYAINPYLIGTRLDGVKAAAKADPDRIIVSVGIPEACGNFVLSSPRYVTGRRLNPLSTSPLIIMTSTGLKERHPCGAPSGDTKSCLSGAVGVRIVIAPLPFPRIASPFQMFAISLDSIDLNFSMVDHLEVLCSHAIRNNNNNGGFDAAKCSFSVN